MFKVWFCPHLQKYGNLIFQNYFSLFRTCFVVLTFVTFLLFLDSNHHLWTSSKFSFSKQTFVLVCDLWL